ncbi:MAG: hypothetical protein JWM72_4726 [Actinomycetia bacterium]|nr:hypothetical protein [Actinomycetes bacterium]
MLSHVGRKTPSDAHRLPDRAPVKRVPDRELWRGYFGIEQPLTLLSPSGSHLIYAAAMPGRPTSTRRYTTNAEPQEVPSALTPAGVIQSYGSAFASLRGRSRWRRFGAIAIALMILSPLVVMAIGYSMMFIRAL